MHDSMNEFAISFTSLLDQEDIPGGAEFEFFSKSDKFLFYCGAHKFQYG